MSFKTNAPFRTALQDDRISTAVQKFQQSVNLIFFLGDESEKLIVTCPYPVFLFKLDECRSYLSMNSQWVRILESVVARFRLWMERLLSIFGSSPVLHLPHSEDILTVIKTSTYDASSKT